MKIAYVDTSVLVAIAFGERGGRAVARRLAEYDELFSANLLEAEIRAAFAREDVVFDETIIAGISWVLPDRSLSAEIAAVLSAGYSKGADLWHLACALFLVDRPNDLTFVTLDKRQRAAARAIGFRSGK